MKPILEQNKESFFLSFECTTESELTEEDIKKEPSLPVSMIRELEKQGMLNPEITTYAIKETIK